MDWPTTVLELGKILGPAIVTGVSAYYMTKTQFKSKEIELKGQADIKAKELVFGAYQKRIERISNLDKDLGAMVDRFAPILEKAGGTVGIQEMGLVLLTFAKTIFPVWEDEIQEIEGELRKLGLSEKKNTQLQFVKDFVSNDLDKATPEQVLLLSLQFVKFIAVLNNLRSDLLTEKCEVLFGEHLNKLEIHRN